MIGPGPYNYSFDDIGVPANPDRLTFIAALTAAHETCTMSGTAPEATLEALADAVMNTIKVHHEDIDSAFPAVRLTS